MIIHNQARKEYSPPHIGGGSMANGKKQSLNPTQVQPVVCEQSIRLPGTCHMHHSRDINESSRGKRPKPIGHDWRQSKFPLPQQRQIQEEVDRLLTERMRNFQRNEAVTIRLCKT
ncbi:hypothetical protein ACFX2F_041534 [Malus domestica]